jgi:hypothetical protein
MEDAHQDDDDNDNANTANDDDYLQKYFSNGAGQKK